MHFTKKHFLNLGLILSSLFGYMEWGGGNSTFLFQAEYYLLFNKFGESETFSHPLVFLPLLGQILLLITLFQKLPNKKLTLIGLAFLSTIMLMILLSGAVSFNVATLLSVVPYFILGVMVIKLRVHSTAHPPAP